MRQKIEGYTTVEGDVWPYGRARVEAALARVNRYLVVEVSLAEFDIDNCTELR